MSGDISKSDKIGNPVKKTTNLKKKLSKHVTVRRGHSLPLKKFKIIFNYPIIMTIFKN